MLHVSEPSVVSDLINSGNDYDSESDDFEVEDYYDGDEDLNYSKFEESYSKSKLSNMNVF